MAFVFKLCYFHLKNCHYRSFSSAGFCSHSLKQHCVCLSVCSMTWRRVSLAVVERSRSRVASRTRCSPSCCHVIASNLSTTQTDRAPTTASPITLRGDDSSYCHFITIRYGNASDHICQCVCLSSKFLVR